VFKQLYKNPQNPQILPLGQLSAGQMGEVLKINLNL